MVSSEQAFPRYREGDVHPIRLRLFLERLGQRLTRADLDGKIAGMPETAQEVCRSVQGGRWLPADEERSILEELGGIDRAYLLIEETGFDVFTRLESLQRLRPASDSLKDVLFRLPAMVALVANHMSLGLRVSSEGEAIEIPVFFHPPHRESYADMLFFWGFLKGLLYCYRLADFDLSLASSALRNQSLSRSTSDAAALAGNENRFTLKLFHGNLEQAVTAHPSMLGEGPGDAEWANQVKARTAELLQDNRELVTAVEYLNMANDELERKILGNQRELDIARNIQKGFVPESVPAWKGLQFRARFEPLREVSGDFYDYFTLGSNKIGFLICDVSGHGVPAALISAIARLSFHNHRLDSPSEVFTAVNHDVLDYVRGEGFVAAFYMIIDSEYRITYSRAGVPAPFLLRAATGEIEELSADGIILGMFADAGHRFRDGHSVLGPGDKLFLFTDGITEALDRNGQMYGEKRVREVARATREMTAEEACDYLYDDYRRHILGGDAKDDVTVVVISLSSRLDEFDELVREARKLGNAGQMDSACALLLKAIEIIPRHPSTLYLLGQYLTRARRFREAMEYLYRYNSMKPYNADSYRVLAECAFHLNHQLQASEFLKKALSLRSEFPAALYLLVLVQLELLNYEKARATFRDLEELKPEHPRVRKLAERLQRELPPALRD